jgi:hypothetical protein
MMKQFRQPPDVSIGRFSNSGQRTLFWSFFAACLVDAFFHFHPFMYRPSHLFTPETYSRYQARRRNPNHILDVDFIPSVEIHCDAVVRPLAADGAGVNLEKIQQQQQQQVERKQALGPRCLSAADENSRYQPVLSLRKFRFSSQISFFSIQN